VAKHADTSRPHEPTLENRRARHDYAIGETIECGLRLLGTEIKSVRAGQMSLQEGYVTASDTPPALILHNTHIGEYPPAGPRRQHAPIRNRTLLAHRREILKLAQETRAKGTTLIPLKVYFVRGKAKILIGIATNKKKSDKRQDIAKREHQRDIDRAMSRRRG
jgi:SsrA-binding protein